MKKTPSINQINGNLAKNQTIAFYYLLSDRHDKLIKDWRNDYHYYKAYHNDERRQLTPAGNFIYSQALYYYREITGIERTSYEYENRRQSIELTYNGCSITFDLKLCLDMKKGVTMQVQAFTPTRYFKPLHDTVFKVRSNDTFASLDLVKYFERYIMPKFFFSSGKWQHIQIVWGLAKNEVIAKWMAINEQARNEHTDPEEIKMKAIIRRLLRYKNIKVEDWIIPVSKLLYVLKSPDYPRQRKIKELQAAPNPFALLEQLSGEFDDEDALLNAAENVYYDTTVMFI